MKKYTFRLTPAYCLYNGVAVIEQKGSFIRFVIVNSEDLALQQRIENAFCNFLEYVGKQEDCPESFKKQVCVKFEKGSRDELRKYVSKLYEADPDDFKGSEIEESDKWESGDSESESAAVLLLDKILSEARERNATDIHIEKNIIRYRIGGRIKNGIEIVSERCDELIQRIKILAGMNVIERRASQDGHFVYGEGVPLFVRVSTIAVIDGKYGFRESMVLRLLDTKKLPLHLEKLGFSKDQLAVLRQFCNLKNGLVLFCGPTGAGKSTSAAAMLMEILKVNGGMVRIISMEDPPEYVLPGISQIHINEEGQNNYDNALSHIFRQDPDVLMIGEIRDSRSARTAVRAALTGHLVLGTVHCDSAATCIYRLLDLGVDGGVLGSVVKGIISQELMEIEKSKGDAMQLLADVAVPIENFLSQNLRNKTMLEMENLFEHNTNHMRVISDSVKQMLKHKKIAAPFYSTNQVKNHAKVGSQ